MLFCQKKDFCIASQNLGILQIVHEGMVQIRSALRRQQKKK